MNHDDLVARAAHVFTPALHLYWPITVVNADGVYVEGADGRSYLDFSSGLAVLNIGHKSVRVMAAARCQMERFVHTGGVYHNAATVTAAEDLVSITPDGLDMVFFSNSGAEAVEGALKLARFVTRRQGIISFTGAFHGRTLGAVSITTSSAIYRKRYHPLLPSVYQVPYPYCFRCPFRKSPDQCDLCCLWFIEKTLVHHIDPDEVAAFIIEPFLGEGGYVPAPREFLSGLRELCDRYGIMLIFDEVQSGMGRTGSWFAVDHYGVTPDILVVAKGIASGFPLSAVVSRREIMSQWPSGAHGTTFGGNPVSCAAASATIHTIRDGNLLERGTQIGIQILTRLHELAAESRAIGDVRGFGCMIGVEFVDETGNPDGQVCEQIMNRCLEEGLILINCGPARNIVRFIPPLITDDDDLERALDIFTSAVRSLQ
ncbi:aspartate aminotransferase family protein [Geobacter pickeringii]|uniref:4-aminobutyrate aminotransferase n=1 Tax=Geobacter pickeringii TaxID=345632 RepID=A0A0B5BFR8_9BACT|nr:aspartate aminotransferase family protein [Geobacter pickeringii]AJE03355.1 4-aminobutyrate aminotransferase [Geobacter pickeringii]